MTFDSADQKQDHTGTWVRLEAVEKRIETLTGDVTRLREELATAKAAQPTPFAQEAPESAH